MSLFHILVLTLCVGFTVASIPVYVMLPLNVISSSMTITNSDTLKSRFAQLKSAGVHGVMSDCWFGLVEKNEKQYDFTPYIQLAQMAKDAGLTMQYVMSFHRCGGNVGDDCNIPLPSWVINSGNSYDIWYKDQHGNRDQEYISLFADNAAVIGSSKRTPIQVYKDFMTAFKTSLSSYIGSTITEVQVGTGPCGELRYPSYQLDKWSFCGVGEFQSYSDYALTSLKAAADSVGHPEWATAGGPNNAGTYNSVPSNTGFFSYNGFDNYKSAYGQFFLKWYADSLVKHGSTVMSAARSVFGNTVELSTKVAGIHWWYFDSSHAAELTAGYYNINGAYDVYGSIASMLSSYNATFDFTCLEMKDSEQSSQCSCGPYELVQQTKQSAISHNIRYSGENALQRYDTTAYGTIKSQSTALNRDINAFTYLRMTDDLFSGSNWNNFQTFVSDMSKL